MTADAFVIPEGIRSVSFVGGGGKTTLMLRLAEQLAAEGKKVVVTTTTHMMRPGIPGAGRQYPEKLPWLAREDAAELRRLLDVSPILLAGSPDPQNENKIVGFSGNFAEELADAADVVLTEADGSRRCPVKVPREWEPALPGKAELVFAVVGMSGIGRRICEAACDPEETAHFLGKEVNEILTEDDICKILRSEQGLRKNVSGEYRVLLNQADTIREQRSAERILQLLGLEGIDGQIFCRRERIAVILMASGLSRRFGSNKLLAGTEDGRPMYLRAVELAEQLEGRRILVSGHEEILSGIREREGWTAVRNEHPERGISESVRLGVQEAGPVDGYLFCVCDQPDLRRESVERLIRLWRRDGRGIAALAAGDRPGNPKLFSAAYREELLGLTGDEGGRRIVRSHPEDLVLLPAGTEEELRDIDTVEEMEKRRAALPTR